MKETLVAIAAHADDVELHAGGMAAKWAAERGDVHIIMMTNNCTGALKSDAGESLQGGPEATTALRHREQAAAAAMIPARVHHMNFSQRRYFNGKKVINMGFEPEEPPPPGVAGLTPMLIAAAEQEHVTTLANLLVSLKPSLVLTQTPVDRDPEHHAVVSMVWRVFYERKDVLKDVPLWLWGPGTSCPPGIIPVQYDHIEDITAYYDRKEKIFSCHASQITPTRLKMMRERAEAWGAKIGVRCAEPFVAANRP